MSTPRGIGVSAATDAARVSDVLVARGAPSPPAAMGWARARGVADTVACRALDLVGAGILLLLLAPVLIALAIAIRLESPGPCLFRQRRIGRGLEGFTVHKFRSMREDADPAKHREYVQALIGGTNNAIQRAGDGPSLYKLAVDDRITRVGRVLRSLSLDELPQLLDVLLGRMSLVGPRPVIPYEVERYPEEWLERFATKPGMTGLWQVSGRNECTYEEMVQFDIEYVRTRTLLRDLGILVRTPVVVLARRGAA